MNIDYLDLYHNRKKAQEQEEVYNSKNLTENEFMKLYGIFPRPYYINYDKYYLRVRLAILNGIDDFKPLIIRKITINNVYGVKQINIIDDCTGAHWLPTGVIVGATSYNVDYQAIEVDSLPPVTISTGDKKVEFNYLTNKIIPLKKGENYYADIYFWTVNIKKRIFCIEKSCSSCKKAIIIPLEKKTSLKCIIDLPDSSGVDMKFGVPRIVDISR